MEHSFNLFKGPIFKYQLLNILANTYTFDPNRGSATVDQNSAVNSGDLG